MYHVFTHTHISTHPNIPDQEQTSNLRRTCSRFSDKMMLLRSHVVSGRTVIRIMTASLDVQTTCCLKSMMSFDLSVYTVSIFLYVNRAVMLVY